jgi:hypothetical protein
MNENKLSPSVTREDSCVRVERELVAIQMGGNKAKGALLILNLTEFP